MIAPDRIAAWVALTRGKHDARYALAELTSRDHTRGYGIINDAAKTAREDASEFATNWLTRAEVTLAAMGGNIIITEGLHECEGKLPADGYGPAIEGCSEDRDGTLWAGNGEYGSQVAYCPYCGFKARTQPAIVTKEYVS